MNKIIGYKQAKELMLQGYKVKTVPQIRDGSIPFLYSPEGVTCYRIRADSWAMLRRECICVKRETFGKRDRNAFYIWEHKGNDKEGGRNA